MYGYFGKHVNVTDGKYVYMRSGRNNEKLYQYTLMPTHLASMFSKEELYGAEDMLCRSFNFAENVPMLKIYAHSKNTPKISYLEYNSHCVYGDLLFDLQNDKEQNNNLKDKEEYKKIKEKMKEYMFQLMKENEAPQEQYERLGLV